MNNSSNNTNVQNDFDRGFEAGKAAQRVEDAKKSLAEILRERPSSDLNISGLEKLAILEAVSRCAGSTSAASKIVGCSVRKIQYRLRIWRDSVLKLVA